jgi:hypothetical protein
MGVIFLQNMIPPHKAIHSEIFFLKHRDRFFVHSPKHFCNGPFQTCRRYSRVLLKIVIIF